MDAIYLFRYIYIYIYIKKKKKKKKNSRTKPINIIIYLDLLYKYTNYRCIFRIFQNKTLSTITQ
jgi:hypothetical protein